MAGALRESRSHGQEHLLGSNEGSQVCQYQCHRVPAQASDPLGILVTANCGKRLPVLVIHVDPFPSVGWDGANVVR